MMPAALLSKQVSETTKFELQVNSDNLTTPRLTVSNIRNRDRLLSIRSNELAAVVAAITEALDEYRAGHGEPLNYIVGVLVRDHDYRIERVPDVDVKEDRQY